MRMWVRFSVSVIAVSCFLLVNRLAVAETTIFLVRHAEKTAGEEPQLSKAGNERADELARMLKSTKLTACFATQYKRTRLTVQPSAEAANLKVQIHTAGQEAKLIKKIKRNSTSKQCILIAGHSNTVPEILRLCGEENPPILGEDDYDNLFVIHLNDEGQKTFVGRLHFGSQNPESHLTK